MRTLTSIIIVAIITLSGCDKDKRHAKRLGGEKWQVTELTMDGASQPDMPLLEFEECDIYNELCIGTWSNNAGGKSYFIWQFRNKATSFEISNQSTIATAGGVDANEQAVIQCSDYSGIYQVVESKKSKMRFEALSTLGSGGKKVTMTIEKQ